MGAWLYILRCADGSYYTGTTRADLEKRIAEHLSPSPRRSRGGWFCFVGGGVRG